jgi:cytoskeletal protein CcmA (bactofilin family)
MASIGRISGPLLKQNLYRNGIDLAFETDLLYLDVNNQHIGIRTSDPQYELDVNGTTRTTDLRITNTADIGDITVQGNTISTDQPVLNFQTLDSVVSLSRLQVDSIEIENNAITTNDSNIDLELRPNGTGSVNVRSDLNVDGNIYATGNIAADGNITVGNEDTDNVTFNAEIASDIIPDATNTYSLGSDPNQGGSEWADVYTENLITSSVTTGGLVVDDINLTLRQGNTYYVAENGDDTNDGDHVLNPFASVKYALSQAEEDDTIIIYPGEYTEEFPLTVPQGVTVKGMGIRSVSIKPTNSTNDEDAFLLNGESTVEDLTAKDFFYNSLNNTGHGFRFANGLNVKTRSPYVKNISVITKGSVTSSSDPRGYNAGDAGKGIFLDGSVASETSKEASGLFNSVTLITPGVDAVTLTNGVRAEWLSSFTYFAKRSVYCVDGLSGLKDSGETALRVEGLDGNFSAGELIVYYDTDGTTILESGVISRVDPDGKFYINNKQSGFVTPDDRPGKTITANGDAQLDTSIKKFGSASLLLDGAGDFASIRSQNDFGFGTDDFTVEGWVYPKNSGGFERLFDFRAGTIGDNAVAINLDGLTPEVYVDSDYRITGDTDLTVNDWNHVSYSRAGSVGTLYLNGTDIGSWNDTTDYGTAKPLVIGALFDRSQNYFEGNIDDVRIIKGVAVEPPSGGPTFRSTVTDETVLMARFDGEDGSTEFKDDVVYAQDIRFSGGATATAFTLTDFTDFGAEVRMIASASVYGEFGLFGDGQGVIVYAIGHNFAYIGNEQEATNDPTTVIQPNEVVEQNGAQIRSVSVDHKGDFRVGDLFFIDQETGDVSFSAVNFNLAGSDGITFSDGTNEAFLSGSKIEIGNWRLSGNTIETLSGNANLDADSDQINLQNNVFVDGNLDVTGNVTIGGNITLGDSSQDTIEFVAGIDSDIKPSETDTYNLGSADLQWNELFVDEIQVDGIEITNNYITTTESNADLELRANGTGEVAVPDNDVSVTGDLTVDGSSTLDFLTVEQDTVIQGSITQTGDFDLDGNLSIAQNLTVGAAAQFEEILIDDNFITTTTSNADLELRANGTGVVRVPDNDVSISNSLSVFGDVSADNLETTGEISATSFTNGNILIDDNYITTTESNSDLEFRTNGTGVFIIDEFSFEANTVSSTNDFVIQPGSQNAIISATGSLQLPKGTTGERPTAVSGQTRFNTELERFEGYNGSNWIQLNGVIDVDGDTFVTAELTEGANDNTIRFTVENSVVADVNESRFRSNKIVVDDIEIDGNLINTATTNTDLELSANGTGSVVFGNFAVRDNTITNTEIDSVSVFENLNNGYIKFDGTSGLVLPIGTNAERPPTENTETGLTRFNTDEQRVEIYNGVSWTSVAGEDAGLTQTDAEETAFDIVMLLG